MENPEKLQTVALCRFDKKCKFRKIKKPNKNWKKSFPYCTWSETCSQKMKVEVTILRIRNYEQIKNLLTPHTFFC